MFAADQAVPFDFVLLWVTIRQNAAKIAGLVLPILSSIDMDRMEKASEDYPPEAFCLGLIGENSARFSPSIGSLRKPAICDLFLACQLD